MKKFLKKLFAFLFVALAVFALVGCRKNNEDDKPEPVLPEIVLNMDVAITLKVGQELELKASVTEGATLLFVSDNQEVLKISGTKAQALKAGTAKVTISVKEYPDIKKDVTVTVEEPTPQEVKVTEVKLSGKAEMEINEEQTLTLQVLPADATNKAVDFATSDATVLTVDANGKVKALKAGTAKVTATAKDGSGKKGEFQITVKEAAPQEIKVTKIELSGKSTMKAGEEQTLTVKVTPTDATNKAVDFASDNTAVLTVDANGKVKAVATGTAKVTATAKDGSGVKGEFSITVEKARPVDPTGLEISINGTKYEEGETVQVTETESIHIDWIYTPAENVNKGVDVTLSNDKYAVIENETEDGCDLKGLTPGKAALVAMLQYGDVEITIVVEVVAKHFDPETITITAKQTTVEARLDLQLTAAVAPEKADQTVIWASSDESIATVNEKGLVTGIAAGKVTITATSAEKADVVGSLEIEVLPEVPFDRTKIYVNPDWISESGKVTYEGQELDMGKNAQYSVAAALKVADEGATIYLLPGDHEDAIDVNKSVYFVGLGEGVNMTGAILLVASLDGFGFENIKFTGAAGIISANKVDPDKGITQDLINSLTFKNFTMKNCTMDKAAAGDDATVHFYGVSENMYFEGCSFNMNTYRGLRWELACTNLTVKNCTFETTGSMYDFIRCMDAVYGEMLVEGCTFGFNNQTSIQVRYTKENSTYTFKDNYFKDATCSYIDLREFNGDSAVANVTINVIGNTFEGGLSDSWGMVRFRSRNISVDPAVALTPEQIQLNFHYNKIINCDPANASTEAPYVIQNANAVEHIHGWMNVEDNYFVLNGTVSTECGATWFQGNEAVLPTWFATPEELDAAYAKYNKGADLFVNAALENEDETHFKTLAGAFAKAEDGFTIEVAAGTYEETVDITKSVKLVGKGEVVIKGFVSASVEIKGLRLENLTIETGTSTAAGGFDDGALQFNEAVEGLELVNVNFAVDAYRGVRFNKAAKDVAFKNCTFTTPNKGNLDWIRFIATATGSVKVEKCVFNENGEFGVYITTPAADLEVEVFDCEFNNILYASIDFREPVAGATNIKYTIVGNKFVGNASYNQWHAIRLRNTGLTAEGSIFADVHFNKFYNTYKDDSGLVQEAGTNSGLKNWVNANFNYYLEGEGETAAAVTDVPAAWVPGQTDYLGGWFESEEALDAAYATFKKTGEFPELITPDTFELVTEDSELKVGETLTVEVKASESMTLTFASSDAEVASISEAGEITALKPGKTTISVSTEGKDPLTFELTVKALVYEAYILPEEGQQAVEYETVNDAIAAAAEGATIVIQADVENSFTIDKTLTITGEEGVVIKAPVYMKPANNVVIKGLEFTGDARVAFYAPAAQDITGFVFEDNYVHDINGAGVAWKSSRYGVGATSETAVGGYPGFLALAGYYSWVKNAKIVNNVFENVKDIAVEIVCTDGATITGNKFYGIALDAIRFDYGNNQGTIVVEDNEFQDVKYSGIFIQSIGGGAINGSVKRNLFSNVAATDEGLTDGYGALGTGLHVGVVATYVHQEKADFKLDFMYNVCMESGNLTLRPNVTNSSSFAKVFDLQVKYNAFINEKGAEAPISRSLTGSDTEATNAKTGTFDYNFYGTDLFTKYAPAAAQFQNPAALDENLFDDLFALEAAVLALEEKLPVCALIVDANAEAETATTFKTLAAAVAAATEDAAIFVKAGTYAEELTIDKKLSIIGPNLEFLGNDENRLPEAVITKPLTITADGVNLIGFEFAEEGVIKVGADNLYIGGCYIHPTTLVACNGNNRQAAIVDVAVEGRDNYVKDLVVYGNKFVITCEKTSYLYNYMAFSYLDGLYLANNYITNTATSAGGGEGIMVYWLKGEVLVYDNTFAWPSDGYVMYLGYYESNCPLIDIQDNLFIGKNANGDSVQCVTITVSKLTEGSYAQVIHNQFINFATSTFYNVGCKAGSTFVSEWNYFDEQQPYKFQECGAATVITNYNCYKGSMHASNVYGGTTGDKADAVQFDSLEALEAAYAKFLEDGTLPSLEPSVVLAQIGEEKYETFAAAYEAAQDGDVIVAFAQEITEELVIEKSITIEGPNKGVSALDPDERVEELVFKGTVNIKADGVTIDGVTQNATFQVYGNDFALLNTNCVEGTHDGANGYVNLKADVDGLLIDACNFEVNNARVVRGVDGKCLGATIINSYFEQTGDAQCDLIRFNTVNGPVLIKDNIFGKCGQTGIFLGSTSIAADVEINSNSFNESGASGMYVISLRNLSAGNISIIFNTFEDTICTRPIDIRPAASYADAIKINYNLFAAPAAEKNQVYVSNYGNKTQLLPADCNYNFFAQGATAGTNVMTSIAIENTFETAEALEAALVDAKLAYERDLKFGTAAKPLTAAQAQALAVELLPNRDDVTEYPVFVKGIICKAPDDKGNYIQQIRLKDSLEDEKYFLVYSCNETAECTDARINDEVVIKGYIKNYNGTLEMADVTIDSTKVYPEFVKITRGESPITVAESSSANATITLGVEKGLNKSEFRFTVAVEEGYILDKVTVNGAEVQGTEGVYLAVVDGETVVKAETHKEGEAVAQLAASVEMSATNFTQNDDNDQFAANEIVVKNYKHESTTDLGHYKAPARFYKNSKVVVEYKEAFVKVVVHCNSASYATSLAKDTIEGATLSAEGKDVTITFATAVSSFEIIMSDGQVRVDSLDVYTLQ